MVRETRRVPERGLEGGEVADVLQRIVAARCERYGLRRPDRPPGLASLPLPLEPDENRFLSALLARAPRAAIAEIKMGSPRLGRLTGRFDPETQAERYARAGAAALSVVVEPDFFFGSFELLRRAREACGLPAIAKDFVVHPRQLDEAAAAGAEAVLLVAALYGREELSGWAAAARERGIVPLVEIHDEAELELLDGGSWELLGVNSRDLRTFEVDLERTVRMASRLPGGAIRVAESGIADRAAVERLEAAGYQAYLIGESLLLANDPERRLRELMA